MMEQSKICIAFDKLRPRACRGEPSRSIQKPVVSHAEPIENPKSLGDSTERAGAGG
jgi:hypothetical protein